MTLHISGINHTDPLCRNRLLAWMKNLSRLYNTAPSFIAVEYKKEHFIKIKSQREDFRRMLQDKRPTLTPTNLDILASSLAYEGDTHISLFPGVDIVWLDEGREINSDSIEEFAKLRLTVLSRYIDDRNNLSLEEISRSICDSSDAEPPSARDGVFADIIKGKINKVADGWALVIIGANHAADIFGSMRYLLEQVKICCKVDFLNKSSNKSVKSKQRNLFRL